MTIGICILGVLLCIGCFILGCVFGSIYSMRKISRILDEKAECEYYDSIYKGLDRDTTGGNCK